MASLTGGTTKDRKGKKPHKNKPLGKKYIHYKLFGESVSKGKICPRCSGATFLADHKTRFYCGKCHYTEFVTK
jgi:small subunit ribosomal protein S27Ae